MQQAQVQASGRVLATSVTGETDGEYTVIATGYPPAASSLRITGEETTHDVALGHSPAD